jgi:hypothetical protein
MHAQEDLAFSADGQSVSLDSYLGPLLVRTCGQYTQVPASDAPPAVTFTFGRVMLQLAGQTLLDKPFAGKQKTYTFLAEDSGVLAVRTSSGGLALLVAEGRMPRQRRNVDFLAIEL